MPHYDGTGYLVSGDLAFAAYLDTACWSSQADGKGELYAHELTEDAVQKMREDWEDFLKHNEADIGNQAVRAANDFWLTRNGHGAGFWDGGWPEPAATRLTKAAKVYGEAHLLAGDNGCLYHS